MESVLDGPAVYFFLFILSFVILTIGISTFTYIITIRLAPLIKAAPNKKFNFLKERIFNFFKFWLMQYKHPRYIFAGILHIIIFAGFIILSIRTFSLIVIGFKENFVFPGLNGYLGNIYSIIKDYTVTIVAISCVIAGIRRGIIKPKRYSVPTKYGKDHTFEAIFVLSIIFVLMISEVFFEASYIAANYQYEHFKSISPPLSLIWIIEKLLLNTNIEILQKIHIFSYYIHDIFFFFFLCFLPLGKHFHVITSIFNIFFMKVEKGIIKPVRYDVKNEDIDNLDSFGVKKLEDFTWKDMLDFYSCADCGRCSDNCPANIVGRPLSPRFISIKARDLMFKNYPIYPYNSKFLNSKNLIETIYNENEIWSCTTCGACEEECPMGINYIDKIVDLRRGLVDDGLVPQSLQKPFQSLEKRGNPWGKMEKKRSDWTKKINNEFNIKDLSKNLDNASTDVLYFVDSITSYDERIQEIAIATSKIFNKLRIDFGILGKLEKDSGNEIRRFGEEMLFQMFKEINSKNIITSGVKKIITSDPHAYNVLKNEYDHLPKVKHLTEFIAEYISSKKLKLKLPSSHKNKVYTYHDPCYLGRHNNVYEAPRLVINSIKNLNYVEMKKNKDRAFCCGGGGLMLFYEPEEDQRMGVIRVKMAYESGANSIITSCPFCLINLEDAIKVSGLEDKIEIIDFSELVSNCIN